MATIAPSIEQSQPFPMDWSLADLVEHLGGISLDRIRMHPLPGTATYKHIEEAAREKQRCELIDGVLVEKPMGWYESAIAAWIVTAMVNFLKEHDLGMALCPIASLRILEDRVRLPDACFIG